MPSSMGQSPGSPRETKDSSSPFAPLETKLLSTYIEPESIVLEALEEMKKACTGPTRVELEKQRLEQSCKDQLEKLKLARAEERAKASGKRWPPKKKKRRNKVLTSSEDKVKALNSEHKSLLKMLDAPPLMTKTFSEIKKESIASHALMVSTRFDQNMQSRAGIPRTLYPELIADIAEEKSEKRKALEERRTKRALKREAMRKAHEEQQAAWNGGPTHTSVVETKLPQSELELTPRASISPRVPSPATSPSDHMILAGRPDLRRPSHVKDMKDQRVLNTAPVDMVRPAMQRQDSLVKPGRHQQKFQTLKSPQKLCSQSDSPAVKRPSSSHMRGASPSRQQLRKEEQEQERERLILENIYARENAQQLKAVKRERSERAKQWLICVATLVPLQRFHQLYSTKIKPEREAIALMLLNDKQKICVKKIETWWFYYRLKLKWIRNKKAARVLTAFFRLAWFKVKRSACANAVRQIKKFLKDSAGSGMVKKLYAYRSKVSRIQKHFRDWLAVQEARTQVLWLAMDQIGAQRKLESRREASLAERNSIKAMWNTDGFRQSMDRMNLTAKNLKKVLSSQEKKMGRKAHEEVDPEVEKMKERELGEMRIRAEEDQRRKTISAKNASHSTDMMLKLQHGLKEDLLQNTVAASKYPTMAQRMRTWYWKTKANPATRARFDTVRNLLTEQRKRHNLAVRSYERKRASDYQSASAASVHESKKTPKVSIAALKYFLLHDEAARDEKFDFFENEEKEMDVCGESLGRAPVRHSTRPPFLLFTKGGLQFFRTSVPLAFFRK